MLDCVSVLENFYHLIGESEWKGLQRETHYCPESLSKEGFIHLSLLSQLSGVVARFYSARTDLVVLVIDRKKLQSPIRYESADGEEFPHLYGPLNLDAVVEVLPLHKIVF